MYLQKFEVKNKTALVTGAGKGIGKASAIALAEAGADLIIVSRTLNDLNKVKKQINKLKRKCTVFECDVSNAAEVKSVFKQINSLDILVNNAGTNRPDHFTKIKKEDTIDTLDIARNKFPGSGISLDALCKRFRIDNSKREKHTALIDCELLAKVYINLLDQKEPKLNFVDTSQNTLINERTYLGEYSKKIISPSPEEIKKHKEFLKKDLKKNFFT